MNTSQAARSAMMFSHRSVPATSMTDRPPNATSVTSRRCQPVVSQSKPTPTNTASVTPSVRRMGPRAVSSLAANDAASGVRRISGGTTRCTTHGTTRHDTNPGTLAATSQPDQVTSTCASLEARPAASTLLACPVRNIAHAIADPWYIAASRNRPSRGAVAPGVDSNNSAMLSPTGSTMPAERAVIEGTPLASVTSVITSA